MILTQIRFDAIMMENMTTRQSAQTFFSRALCERGRFAADSAYGLRRFDVVSDIWWLCCVAEPEVASADDVFERPCEIGEGQFGSGAGVDATFEARGECRGEFLTCHGVLGCFIGDALEMLWG